MIQPPTVGPKIGATTTPWAKIAMAAPRFCRGKLSNMMDCAIGTIAPPPIPCRMRATIRLGRSHARPHRAEATVNMKMQAMNRRLRPK